MSNRVLVSVRVSQRERELLEAAADQSRTNLSDFIRRSAVETAEIELLQRNRVIIPAAKWKKFETWVNGPTKDVPALKRGSRRVARYGKTDAYHYQVIDEDILQRIRDFGRAVDPIANQPTAIRLTVTRPQIVGTTVGERIRGLPI